MVNVCRSCQRFESRQFVGVRLYFANGFGYLVHVTATGQQHSLGKPNALLAKLIVCRARDPVPVSGERALIINPSKRARRQRVIQKRLLIQRRVSTRTRDSLRGESL